MKTTNPSLIKKYFKGTLSPGDHSKDFIIEPDYALVFNGKVPYRTTQVNVMVAWRNSEGKFYVRSFYPTHPIAKHIKEIKDADHIFKRHPQEAYIIRASNLLQSIISAGIKGNQARVDIIIGMYNDTFTMIRDPEKLRVELDKLQRPLEALWDGKLQSSIDGLDEFTTAYLMERRITK